MAFIRAVRAWILSIAACACLLAVWTVGMQALTGRWEPILNNMLNVTVAFGAVFAVTAATLHVPVFTILGTRAQEPLSRRTAALVGAALAPAAYVAVAWRFGEFDQAQSIGTVVRYWIAHLPEVALGALPFVAAGALFGVFWQRTAAPAGRLKTGGVK